MSRTITASDNLDQAANVWSIVTALTVLALTFTLRNSGVATWAPTLAFGLVTVWLVHARMALAAEVARHRGH